MYGFDVREGSARRTRDAEPGAADPQAKSKPSELRQLVEAASRLRFSMPRVTEPDRARRGRRPIVHG